MTPRLALLLLIILVLPGRVAGQGISPERAARVDSLFSAFHDRPGAAVAIVLGDSVVLSRGYGLADLENQVPITPETVFLIASVSKQFTAFAMAMLEQRGQLDLTTDIHRFFPALPASERPMTIRHLIHHTSGLRDSFDMLEMAGIRMDDVIRQEDILRLAFGQEALNFEPGAEYSYSNTGYALQAALLTVVTGEPFAAWMKREIFDPLGMRQSRFLDDRTAVIANRANGYASDGKEGFQRQLYAYESVGETGLFTTVGDLAKWVVNARTGQVGGAEVIQRTLDRGVLNSGDSLSYAFGQSLGSQRGHRRISHSGWHRGFRTWLGRFPDDDLAVIVLGNANDFEAADLGAAVADLFFEPGRDSLSVYAGTYGHAGMDSRFTIVLDESGQMKATHPRAQTIRLTWVGPDTFSGDSDAFDTLRFIRSNGRVTAFLGETSRSRNVRFERILP